MWQSRETRKEKEAFASRMCIQQTAYERICLKCFLFYSILLRVLACSSRIFAFNVVYIRRKHEYRGSQPKRENVSADRLHTFAFRIFQYKRNTQQASPGRPVAQLLLLLLLYLHVQKTRNKRTLHVGNKSK